MELVVGHAHRVRLRRRSESDAQNSQTRAHTATSALAPVRYTARVSARAPSIELQFGEHCRSRAARGSAGGTIGSR